MPKRYPKYPKAGENMKNNHIEIIQGSINEKQIFRNLMQFYKYDTSDFTLEDPTLFGQFDYNYLDHYWTPHGITREGRKAYLLKIEGQLAGFALVNNFNLRNSVAEAQNIAEFFVMRKWRRQGIGRIFAFYLFDTFNGEWEIKQEKENENAQRFWSTVVSEYTNNNYSKVESHEPEWEGPVIRFKKEF
jgi:predicted acetyltransferase